MYGSHLPNRGCVTKDGYTYLPKLTVKLDEDNISPVQKDTNIYIECIESIMSGQDNKTIEGFQTVLEEVGKVVNISDNIVDIIYRRYLQHQRL